ncbi:TPA: hypothetical protein QEM72_002700 [Pseudomonas putida]|uniref:hypothetical protein n=1 Tax=Pseudomonas putida TaxID=303 RepID=UPI0023639F77|nr:hypothetical protein [Pseudomonas putida]MDD2076436.1 hypothetical protein [Pseudomonas putida]HDS1692196.1 hypothetical protein [Pseudomonas putida]
MPFPEEPERDTITAYLLNVFRNVCRGRQYLTSMAGAHPMRLGYREINDFLAAHPSPLPRHFVDEVVFALDDIVMAEKEAA